MDPATELAHLGRRIADGETAQRKRTILIGTLAAQGWTQIRIADAAGISQQAVSAAINRANSQIFIRTGIRADIAAGTNPRDSLARYTQALSNSDNPKMATYLADFEAILNEETAA
jgi:transcriptional regulator with XRE-family HTH domain